MTEVTQTDHDSSKAENSLLKQLEELIKERSDSRMATYAVCLSQLPENEFPQIKKVGEVGMNRRIFTFASIFPKDAIYYGITLDPAHKAEAEREAMLHGARAAVWLKDIEDGIPEGWNEIDLLVDIFSAGHYADRNKTLDFFSKALKKEGYLLFVPGDFFGGLADFTRNHPESNLLTPLFRYSVKTETSAPDLEYSVEHSREEAADLVDKRARIAIADQLRDSEYEIPEDSSWENLAGCMENMAKILGVKVVTSFDLRFVGIFKQLEKNGFKHVKQFVTPDGMGIIAQKA